MLLANRTRRRIERDALRAIPHQRLQFEELVRKASSTQFGRDHGFTSIRKFSDFARQVPIRDYEDLKPYIDRIKAGHSDVIWPGKPLYFAKTSGTTSGVKYIPITRDSIPNHIHSAKDALFNAASRRKLHTLFDGKMIFLSGSPVLEETAGIPTGRLSGIVNHWIPTWLRANQMPSYPTNCIDDWETKVDRIAYETLREDMRLISGIPPWVQMYYERLLDISSKSNILELFPNFQLFVYGGVNFEPYRNQLECLVGGAVNTLETYPASEGFIAFQDLDNPDDGLLLLTRSGIFYEFIPTDQLKNPSPDRLTLGDVETGKEYAVILSSNAGLWAYSIGDTVEFVSLHPYRLKVTGRIKHFISAFGEHVISKEVEEALKVAVTLHPCLINEFSVAPQVQPAAGQKPHHEWWIEFAKLPDDLAGFEQSLNESMQIQNLYYRDLLKGKILQPLVVRQLPPGSFKVYMQSIGKLGGQNKVPRLSNDRNIANALEAIFGTPSG